MARYIDADALKERLRKVRIMPNTLYGMGINAGIDRVETAIDAMPTEDVAPKSEEGAECPTCHGTGRIGTTDWLTKNISKEQLAKEKAEAIAEHELHIKQDYAREIFEEIENTLNQRIKLYYTITVSTFDSIEQVKARASESALRAFRDYVAELKKKYTEATDEVQHS